ncbi:GNAT family N-acetyltransferase [Saccharibacillus kuerlensis]|uniref:Protein kinase domain-containing protein n=1 Tax=Saccharibacillus kuerlensis TaxID=459527 RepID=A0ABQ2L4S3_9BACL|nr:GNAT family N-acetyltransferase [Saccharibacillus kuerlensis]GGO03054.1 hypothetical protein GCM10010969_26960 [Saccharibacillus kuerlensis]
MEREKGSAAHEETPALLTGTPRLLIRRFGSEEWGLLLTYLQEEGVADDFPEGVYTEQRLRSMTANPELYALILHENGEVIGHVFFRSGLQPGSAEFELGIRESSRSYGYADEAAQALLRYAFGRLDLHRVTVSCPPENLALRATLEKLGMRMEAFFRQNLPTIDGDWRDECIYAMLEEEWLVREQLIERRERAGSGHEGGGYEVAAQEEGFADTISSGLQEEPQDTTITAEEAAAFLLDMQADHSRAQTLAGDGESGDLAVETKKIDEPDEETLHRLESDLYEEDSDAEYSLQDHLSPEEIAALNEEMPEPYMEPGELDEPGIPQVTLAIGEEGSLAPFAPIIPAPAMPPAQSGPVVIAGTVVGVQRSSATEPDPLGGLIEQRIDGVPFLLREPHDLNWLAPFGRVFRVWDRQDSGNLSFGLEIEDQKVFIKYAGAATADYEGHPAEAIRLLQGAAQVYEALRHPVLVQMLDHFDTPDGYAILFGWAEGELLRPSADLPPEHPDSAIYRFRKLPVEDRVAAMEDILDFHAHAEALGYAAIDFYDGSLIYDFDAGKITICDIDLYRPKPYTNERGRMWGSSRFMSPEEYKLGAPIDSRTNVYNMGAMAFCLLGGELDRSRELWDAGDELYRIALLAASPDREERWESVAQMLEAWRQAL